MQELATTVLRFASAGARAASARLALAGAPTKTSKAFMRGTHKLHGVEIFPGVGIPVSRSTRYGATFVAVERGKTPVTLVGWVNYTPIFFKPGTECAVVGGRWWLVATEGIRHRGTLHGSFSEGKIRWNKDAKLAEASIRLRVSGGVGVYRGFRGTGNLMAALNHLPFPPFPPRIGGTLELARYGSDPARKPPFENKGAGRITKAVSLNLYRVFTKPCAILSEDGQTTKAKATTKRRSILSLWSKSRGPLEERRVLIGGLICTFALAAGLFARDHWKGGIFVSLWAPPFFRLADLLRERIEG